MIGINSYKGIMGATIGDVYGSYYEFQSGPKTPKESICLHESSTFTDDTVLTCAVAEYCEKKVAGENVSATEELQKWARAYPNAGYGGRFVQWMYSSDPKPYLSFGNGSAMRVSPVAYFAKSLEECRMMADEVTMPTHNHHEGIKGAEVVACCIFMSLHGSSKKEIEGYASKFYDLKLDYNAMMASLGHGEEICQVTVPQAIWCFLHSDSFEDCLRLSISIRWDADTLAAIACSIAEAYYKEIPADLLLNVKNRLDYKILETLEKVDW
jgi:ADP-ribosylglycohydrolase